MGALPPNPRDLALLFSRMGAFRFTRNGACRTIDLLARRIGLRRDATRAPMQVRNGWRPSGRRSDRPAAPSKNGRNFVQPMGSTSNCRKEASPLPLRFLCVLRVLCERHTWLCMTENALAQQIVDDLPLAFEIWYSAQ